MSSITHSLDNRSFATGVKTTTNSISAVVNLSGLEEESSVSSDQTMDKTQSNEVKEEKKKEKVVKVVKSPLKISYEKPRLFSLHFKTLSHLIATCLLVPLLIETVFIFSSITQISDQNKTVGALNALAVLMCGCHVAMFIFWKSQNMKTAVMTCWASFLMLLLLTISGFYIWTSYHIHIPQIIVPLHYFWFFGSIVTLSFAGMAVYVEHQATLYAVSY